MKKFYYLLVLIGIVACTDSIEVYDDYVYDENNSDNNVAYIYYETGGSISLDEMFIKYFGQNYAERTNLKAVLSGTMSSADFADIRGLSVLDMSDVTLTDRVIPGYAFSNSTLDSLVLPTTGSLILIQENAFAGSNLIEISIPTSVVKIEENIFETENTTLQTIGFDWSEESALPTFDVNVLPERFLKPDDLDSYLSSEDEDGDEIEYVINVPLGKMYIYKQSEYWSQYNLKEVASTDGSTLNTITVYVESKTATTATAAKPMLESEIIEVMGEDYATIQDVDLIIKGELIEEDFNTLRNAKFNSVDLGDVTIVGDVLVEGANMGASDVDTYCKGNALPDSAFINNTYLTKVIIPSSVEYIGYAAFKACYNLVDISFTPGVKSNLQGIYCAAFSQCLSLVTPDFLLDTEIKMISDYAFGGCTSITGMTVPESVDSLGNWIINASEVCAFIYMKWEDNPLTCNTESPPFPSQFAFGGDAFITIPDGTREIYERAGWGYYNLKESSQTVSTEKMWTITFEDNFDDDEYTSFWWDHTDGYYNDDKYEYSLQYFTDDNWGIVALEGADFEDKNSTDKKYLVIEGKKEQIYNQDYIENSSDWNTVNPYAEYTSSRLSSSYEFMYGRVKVRAKLPTGNGAWPAISTAGRNEDVIANLSDQNKHFKYKGMVDIATYTGGSYLVAFTWAGFNYNFYSPDSRQYEITDPDEFHTWLYEWSETRLDVYLFDNEVNEFGFCDSTLVHTVWTADTHNWNWTTSANTVNPFTTWPQYINLTLALGSKGGSIEDDNNLPKMIIDYIQVWEEYWVYKDFNN